MTTLPKLFASLALSGLLIGCSAPEEKQELEKSFSILHVNDVYRISGVDAGANGGLDRLRTLRRDLEKQYGDLLVLHAGDFLFPSMMSRSFNGEQMIDVMNLLDGQRDTFDDKLFVVFGNHEFDKRKLKHAGIVSSRLKQSEFTWLNGNITWEKDEQGNPLVSNDNTISHRIIDINGVKVGLFGITTNLQVPAYAAIDTNYVEIAKRYTKVLREQGAEVVVALTHLRMGEDKSILEALGSEGPDVIFGGHEHHKQAELVNGRYVLKADADIRTATVATIDVNDGKFAGITHEFKAVNESVKPDPVVKNAISQWQHIFDKDFCDKSQQSMDCLNKQYTKTNTELVGEELSIRRYETNLGNFIVDQALNTFASDKAQIAFINSGSMRLNQNIPAGAYVTERHLMEIFQYPSNLKLIEISGEQLQQVISHSIEDWTGNGWWLQIAGFRYTHDVANQQAVGLEIMENGSFRAVKPDEKIVAVTNDFLMNPSMGQDDYTMLVPANLKDNQRDVSLVNLVREALQQAGEQGISPKVEGRICSTDKTPDCPK